MTTPRRELESALEGFFTKAVREMTGGFTVKLAPTTAGVPDRLAVLYGSLHLVELKTTTGRLSPIQQAFHARVNELRVPVHTLHGKGEVIAWIRARMDDADNSRKRGANAARRLAAQARCCAGCDGTDCCVVAARLGLAAWRAAGE